MFGKDDERVVDWINNDLATYINKEKAALQSALITGNIGQKSLKLSAPLRTNRGSPQ